MQLLCHIYESVRVARLAANTTGRDFVVGDLHGHFDSLIKLLHAVNFDPDFDRVLSTGDLINRGPDSDKCLSLIDQPWFHAVLGNHEMCFVLNTCQIEGAVDLARKSNYEAVARSVGGAWYLDGDAEKRFDMATRISLLPHVMVVGMESSDRYHVVHGALSWSQNVLQPIDNYEVDRLELHGDSFGIIPCLTEHRAIWKTIARHDNESLSLTYCGHTPNAVQLRLSQSHLNIDLGAGHPDSPILGASCLGLMCHQTKTLWSVETNHPDAEVLEDRDAFYRLSPPAYLMPVHPEPVLGEMLSDRLNLPSDRLIAGQSYRGL